MSKLNADMLLLTQTQWDKINDIFKHLVSFNNNKTKIYLFRKLQKELGFEIEGLQKRGAYLREGIFLDVYLMGKLID